MNREARLLWGAKTLMIIRLRNKSYCFVILIIMHYSFWSNFASARESDRELVVYAMVILIVATWIPSHHFFKWLRKKPTQYSHNQMVLLSIIGCLIITAVLVASGVWLGDIITDPNIRSLGSSANVNFMWFPFALLALGMWTGFLSGYVKMRIS